MSSLLAILMLTAACSSDDDSQADPTTTSIADSATTAAPTTSAFASTTTDGGVGGSLRAAIEGGAWTDNVSFTFSQDTYTLDSDGIPSHEYPDQWAVPNDPLNISADNAMVLDNLVSAQNYSFELPLTPVYSETTTDTAFGTIGIMVSGAALFDPYEGGGGVALDGNFDLDGVVFIDACNGHPQGSGAYHYHGIPYCITDAVDAPGEHSTMIGVLLDGFPIYGPNDVAGAAPDDLDECSGHIGPTPEFPDGIYHYHLMETAPYSVTCYHGEIDAALLTSGAVQGDAPAAGAAPPNDAGSPAPPADIATPAPQGAAGATNLARAAATLGISEQELAAALGPPPPDYDAAADVLGLAVEDLVAALG